jgi:hypothetical protein
MACKWSGCNGIHHWSSRFRRRGGLFMSVAVTVLIKGSRPHRRSRFCYRNVLFCVSPRAYCGIGVLRKTITETESIEDAQLRQGGIRSGSERVRSLLFSKNADRQHKRKSRDPFFLESFFHPRPVLGRDISTYSGIPRPDALRKNEPSVDQRPRSRCIVLKGTANSVGDSLYPSSMRTAVMFISRITTNGRGQTFFFRDPTCLSRFLLVSFVSSCHPNSVVNGSIFELRRPGSTFKWIRPTERSEPMITSSASTCLQDRSNQKLHPGRNFKMRP